MCVLYLSLLLRVEGMYVYCMWFNIILLPFAKMLFNNCTFLKPSTWVQLSIDMYCQVSRSANAAHQQTSLWSKLETQTRVVSIFKEPWLRWVLVSKIANLGASNTEIEKSIWQQWHDRCLIDINWSDECVNKRSMAVVAGCYMSIESWKWQRKDPQTIEPP